MRKIQQLVYDVNRKRLFCPEHPDRTALESKGPKGFAMICTALLAPDPATNAALNCMNTAEWASREDMERDLKASESN